MVGRKILVSQESKIQNVPTFSVYLKEKKKLLLVHFPMKTFLWGGLGIQLYWINFSFTVVKNITSLSIMWLTKKTYFTHSWELWFPGFIILNMISWNKENPAYQTPPKRYGTIRNQASNRRCKAEWLSLARRSQKEARKLALSDLQRDTKSWVTFPLSSLVRRRPSVSL